MPLFAFCLKLREISSKLSFSFAIVLTSPALIFDYYLKIMSECRRHAAASRSVPQRAATMPQTCRRHAAASRTVPQRAATMPQICRSEPQRAAACRSVPQRAAVCRSEPQRAAASRSVPQCGVHFSATVVIPQ